MLVTRSSPFGSRSRTLVLLALRLLGESYARELTRLLDVSLASIQQALYSLEADGLVTGRTAGRTKLFRLNPRYFAREELERLLRRLEAPEVELRGRVEGLRRRPRLSRKPL